MGLVYKTTKWLDRLWSEHLQMSSEARSLVQRGIEKQGPDFAGFPADVHARLYLPWDPPALDTDQDWAVVLHEQATAVTEWNQLRTMCARNGFAAGIAAEAMLEQLLPLVPDRPEKPCEPSQPSVSPQLGEPSDTQPQSSPNGSPTSESGTGACPESSGLNRAELRAALRRASRAARKAVTQAESGLEGVGTPLGFSSSGAATIRNTGRASLVAVRAAHAKLAHSGRLRRIAQIAGRLERVCATKARSNVRPGAGELHGVGLGADVSRLLPSELVGLRHPRLRMATLARIVEGRALLYSMQGREPAGRGPIVVLLDESASMNDGERDIWSKAVALTLLSTATRQKRSWHLIGFNGSITREVEIAAGRATPTDIQDALDHGCRGGTRFDQPVLRAIDIIRRSRIMRAADVIIITDGEDSLEPTTTEAATALTKSEGVSWYVIGVGPDAEQCVSSLGSIATNIVRLAGTDEDEALVDIVVLDRDTPGRPSCG